MAATSKKATGPRKSAKGRAGTGRSASRSRSGARGSKKQKGTTGRSHVKLWVLAAIFAAGVAVGGLALHEWMKASAFDPPATQASVLPAPVAAAAKHPLPNDPTAIKPVTQNNPPPVSPVKPVIAKPADEPKQEDPIANLVRAELDHSQPPEPLWRRNAVKPPFIGGRPMIALVIDDVGVAQAHAWETVRLPAPVTIAFMTYAKNLDSLTEAARRQGHELMIHVPMEPVDAKIDPGPEALHVGDSDEEINRRLDWAFQRFSGYVGINNHMGSRFTSDPKGMALVMAQLKQRGLLFLDSKTIASSVGDEMAARAGLPHIVRDVFLDDEVSAQNVNEQLRQTEAVARKKGYAVAIGHPHPQTLTALRAWIPTLESKGFVLVPLTTIVAKRNGDSIP